MVARTNHGLKTNGVSQNSTTPIVDLKSATCLAVFNTGPCSVKNFWIELETCLHIDEFRQILKVQRVQNRSSAPYMKMWVNRNLGDMVISRLSRMTRSRTISLVDGLHDKSKDEITGPHGGVKPLSMRVTKSWRVKRWLSWKERHKNRSESTRKCQRQPLGRGIFTWNVRGYRRNKEIISEVLEENCVSVACLQETLVREDNFPLTINGYVSYTKPAKDGFRGLALLVDDRLSSYEDPTDEDHLIHVKISGVEGDNDIFHIIGLYLPSGGTFRKERSKLIGKVKRLTEEIGRLNPDSRVVILGDLNTTAYNLDKRILKGSALQRLHPVGNDLTYFTNTGRGKSLDHILCNPLGTVAIGSPKVLMDIAYSDHKPVLATFHKVRTASWSRAPKARINTAQIKVKSKEIAHHNKWSVLEKSWSEHEVTTSDQMALDLVETMKSVCTDEKVLVDSSSPVKKDLFPKHLKVLHQRVRDASSEMMESPSKYVKHRLDTLKTQLDTKLKSWRVRRDKKYYERISESLADHDLKNAYLRINQPIHKSRSQTASPVRDRNGVLQTTPEGILNVFRDHYYDLLHEVKDKDIHTSEYWKDPIDERKYSEMDGLDAPISWIEIIFSIRKMRRGTAPGLDGIHVNVLKSMVLEECMAHIGKENPEFRRKEYIDIHLPGRLLPEEPVTPLGRVIYKVICRIWESEIIPDVWSDVEVVTLFKSGDPELTTNYRGISLISSALKILLSVMERRISRGLAKNGIIVAEQSGSTVHEEAIVQFTAISEILRRRSLANEPTFVFFIDVKKAYDSPSHEGLYHTLHHYGVRGKYLRVVKNMYSNSRVVVRVSGKLSDPFKLRVGVRQGAPEGPIFWALYFNRSLASVRGVGMPTGLKRFTRHGFEPWYKKADDWEVDESHEPIEEDLAFSNLTWSWTGAGLPVPIWAGQTMEFPPDLYKGGLYVDDIAGLASTFQRIKESVSGMDEDVTKIGIHINAKKSGWMFVDPCTWTDHGDNLLYQFLNQENVITLKTGEVIPRVQEYKYLGIMVNKSWGRSRDVALGRKSMEAVHADKYAKKGMKALFNFRPMLTNRRVTPGLRSRIVRSLIYPHMLYGSEWFGMKQLHAEGAILTLNTSLKKGRLGVVRGNNNPWLVV